MKTIRTLFALLALLCSLTGFAQNSIFDKYSDMRNVSSVYISKAMIEMSPNLYTNDVYIGKVAGQLDAVYIVSTMDNVIKKDMRKDIESFIEKGKYELLMKQKGIVSRSAFYVKKKGLDKVRELVMITDGAATLKFVSLVGDLTLQDIQKITTHQNTSENTIQISTDRLKEIFNGVDIDLSGLSSLEGLKDLAGLKKLEELKSLKGLEGLKSLERLKSLEGLKNLEGLEDLKGLTEMESLEGLEGVDELKESLKGLEPMTRLEKL